MRGHFVIVRDLHRLLRAALGERTQLVDVAEHVGERHDGLDGLGVAPAVGALDLPAATVEIADHVAHIFLWGDDLDLHHRFEQIDAGLRLPFAHRRTPRDPYPPPPGTAVVISAAPHLDYRRDNRH